MLENHLLSMTVFAGLVSLMLACLRAETGREIVRAAGRNLLFIAGGVFVASWVMRVL
jgi:hypothetical protein